MRGPASETTPRWRYWGASLPLLALWWMPWLPPLWHQLLGFSTEIVRDPGVGATNSSRTQFLLLAITALAFAGWRRPGPESAPPLWRSPAAWATLFLLWSALSALAGPDPLESLFFWSAWVTAFCVWRSAPAVIAREPGRAWRAAVLHAPLAVAGLLSLAPMLSSEGDFRAAGPFQLPGTLATWLLMVLPLALLDLLNQPRRSLLWPLVSTTLGLAALIMTFSRAAWLAGIAELVLLILLLGGSTRRSLLGWGGFAAAGLAALLLARGSLTGLGLLAGVALLGLTPLLATAVSGKLSRHSVLRLLLVAGLAAILLGVASPAGRLGSAAEKRLSPLTQTDDSAVGRMMFWQAALELSLRHPVLGVGPGRFSESYPQVQRYYYYYSDSAHGALLEGVAEVGWVGGGLFLLALGLAVGRAGQGAPTPGQRAALAGLLTGAVYSQVEVGYHFTAIWTTGAFLLAYAEAQGASDSTPSGGSVSSPPLWLLATIPPLLWVFSWQRTSEDSVRQAEALQTYRLARQVSEQVPAWPKPTLTALAFGLREGRPPAELDPLAQRALTWARGESVTYQLAGELDLLQGRYSQAKAHFARALELDPFNHPGSLHGLLQVASATGDQELNRQTIERTLTTYDLDKGWQIAHIGHRQRLALELRPLLYDIADGLRPDLEPERTEPLYRFLVETGGEARGLYGWGLALATLGRTREGHELMRRAHQMNPVYPLP